MRAYQAASQERSGHSGPSRTTPGIPWCGPEAISPVATSSATSPTTEQAHTAQTASTPRVSKRSRGNPVRPARLNLHHLDELAHRAGGALELRLLCVAELDLDDLLEPVLAE